MRKLLDDGPVYLQIVALWPQIAYAYRLNLIADVLALVLQIFLLKVVWTAVYAAQSSVDGISLTSVITFLTLANLQMWVMSPVISGFLRDWIRDGSVSLHLSRPVGFVGQMISHQIGATAGLFPFLVAAFPLAAILGGMQPPASPVAALTYLVSLGLSYWISTLIALLLGLIAFWTFEIQGVLVIHRFVTQFFSGALVPLWFFPPALRVVANVLPFQAQAFIPVSIYLGQVSGVELLASLGLQLFWVVVLYLIVQIVWHRALHRVVVQGG